MQERDISERMIRIMVQEYGQKEYLASICKVAILKYYAGKQVEPAMIRILENDFKEMCKNRFVLPFYLTYPQSWLREVQLYDKVMIEYRGKIGGKVKVLYRISKEGTFQEEYHSEVLLPMYDNVYVKEFVLYEGEVLHYYFEEITDTDQIISEKSNIAKREIVYEEGKYGRLNLISRLSKEKQYEAMLYYKKEERISEELFPTY